MMSIASTAIGRRAMLVLAAMMLALIVSSGAALAISKTCELNVECVGTKEADILNGSDGGDIRDVIFGRGGADTLNGIFGDDDLYGQDGPDQLSGGPGVDQLIGGPGLDTLSGGADLDSYYFGAGWGKESITDSTTPANMVLFKKGPNQDVFVTDDLTIRLISGKGPEVKNHGRTSTLNWEGSIIEDVQSGSGDDQITGNSLGNFINAGTGGADTISSFGGDDFINVSDGAGDDVVDCGQNFLGSDNDTVLHDLGDQIADNCENQ
jgi:hypothetical protein